ncbi:MAG TPA: porphobilinogen synthase [Candidatus Binataceae bacterium]|nr:porphobilinogen synthase [Candidatus Binataceae bacterium]
MPFPLSRPRRLRRSAVLRRMVRETRLSPDNLIAPLFVREGRDQALPIAAMPGVAQLSVDRALKQARELHAVGVPAIILFGIPDTKDALGSQAWNPAAPVQRAVAEIKEHVPELAIITDVCLCEYTDHGHCGLIREGAVDNDASLELLARTALSHAQAGADLVAPSDMMDGRVGAIRRTLDQAGFDQVAIMAYSAKYASAFYGPFREAAQSAPQFGDRRSYQMDPANGDEALREVALDLEEGADIVMVKPALAYLDLIYRVKQKFACPLAAYNVSGEYSMICAAGRNGWLDQDLAAVEVLTAIKRAGADLIITYFAYEVAGELRRI